jgi:hypothetical protein
VVAGAAAEASASGCGGGIGMTAASIAESPAAEESTEDIERKMRAQQGKRISGMNPLWTTLENWTGLDGKEMNSGDAAECPSV